MKHFFSEKQRFNQWWLYVIMGGILLFTIISAYKQFEEGVLFTKDFLDENNMLMASSIILIISAFIFIITLKTKIDDTGIRMNFFPFKNKFIVWDNIDSVEVVNYGFVGGWGIRLWTKYGTVYNIRGNKGVAIKLKNGDKFLIGTQKEDELREVISHFTNTLKED